MFFKFLLLLSFLSIGAQANTEAIKFLKDIDGQQSLSGDASCEGLNILINEAQGRLNLEIGNRSLYIADELSDLSLKNAQVQGNKIIITKVNKSDKRFNQLVDIESVTSVVIEKEGNVLKRLSAVYKYKDFNAEYFLNVNEINCK